MLIVIDEEVAFQALLVSMVLIRSVDWIAYLYVQCVDGSVQKA